MSPRLRFHLHKLELGRYIFGCFIGVSYLILHMLPRPSPPDRKGTMRLTPWYLAAVAPLAVAGCTGTFFLGHFAVLAVTLGIFFGTLSLGRQAVARHDTSPRVAEKVDV
jgi:hypothetical protein